MIEDIRTMHVHLALSVPHALPMEFRLHRDHVDTVELPVRSQRKRGRDPAGTGADNYHVRFVNDVDFTGGLGKGGARHYGSPRRRSLCSKRGDFYSF